MGLKKLSDGCRKCPFVDTCTHKQIEALAYLPEQPLKNASVTAASPLSQPILRETMTIVVSEKPYTVYKDEIEKKIYKSLYSDLRFAALIHVQ